MAEYLQGTNNAAIFLYTHAPTVREKFHILYIAAEGWYITQSMQICQHFVISPANKIVYQETRYALRVCTPGNEKE